MPEPELCPNCPRKLLLDKVRRKSWTNEPTIEMVVMLCAKLRAYKETDLPRCPEFPESETMSNYVGHQRRQKVKFTRFEMDKNPDEYISKNHFSL